jgi:biotin carboxyl carrier protein
MALKITIDQSLEYAYEAKDGEHLLDGKAYQLDMTPLGNGKFHILQDGKSYNAEVVAADPANKVMTIKVDGRSFSVNIADKFDQLLKDLGMDAVGSKKIKEVKAPMPGLVVDVLVKKGDEVQEGDSLLILSAMKMENVLKSPGEGQVKSISAKKDAPVEKGEVLIEFE